MPVILPAGCRVCGAGVSDLRRDKDGKLYCSICRQKEKEMIKRIEDIIIKALEDK